RAGIDVFTARHSSHGHAATFGVRETRQPGGYAGRDPVAVGAVDDATCLPALEVQVDAANPKRIRPRAIPIDALEKVTGVRTRPNARFQREETVVCEPGIQMHPALKAVEAVIAEHDDERAVVGVFQHAPDDGIARAVVILDHVPELRPEAVTVRRVPGFSEPPEHV